MRIRKRSILPFLLSSPRFPSNLSSLQNPSPQRREEAKQRLKEADSKEGDEEIRDPEEENESKERSHQRIDPGRCIRIHYPENGPENGGFCGAIEGKDTHDMKESGTLSTPVLGQVEALQEEEEERRSAREKGYSARNMKGLGEETSKASGRWDERERVFPLKKRKGSFQWRDEKTVMEGEKEKQTMTKTKVKRKITTKRVMEEEEIEQDSATKSHVKKVRATSSGALMEGSRCSRINGRGWRCCQQTLVGYSLCEHHLGKGRLRSMSSFPSQAATVKSDGSMNNNSTTHGNENSCRLIISTTHKIELKMGETERKNEKKKIGMVKARSISSLLGLSSSTMAAAVHPSDSSAVTSASTSAATT